MSERYTFLHWFVSKVKYELKYWQLLSNIKGELEIVDLPSCILSFVVFWFFFSGPGRWTDDHLRFLPVSPLFFNDSLIMTVIGASS